MKELDDIYETFCMNRKDSIVVAPRRFGKTTLVTNCIVKLLNSHSDISIMVLAPQKAIALNITERLPKEIRKYIKIATTINNITGIQPDYLFIEEAAFIKKYILKTAMMIQCPKLITSSPRTVTYSKDETGEIVSDCYLKDLCDNSGFSGVAYYKININNHQQRDKILEERFYFSEDQFTTEILAEWICKYEQ
jgi:hypothetical protein